MRICLISTLSRPVPPVGEGSVELLVSLLANGLVERGHDVALYALPGSNTKATLRSPVESSYVTDPDKWDWQLYEAYQVREAFSAWRDFDIIHCHSYQYGLLFADTVPIPSVHSVHTEPGPDWKFLARRTVNRHLLFASKYQAREFENVQGVHVVPDGIDVGLLGVSSDVRPEYLAYMGRFHPDKGPLSAIAVAQRSGLPLKLAGPANDYFRDAILPLIDGEQIQYVGEICAAEKGRFLAGAIALLYPVTRGEPFGLVLPESLAVGTPVLAFREGAVPEIIDDGITGYIGTDENELAAFVPRAQQLDRQKIQSVAKQRFSADTMVAATEALYQQIINAGTAATGQPA